MAKDKSTQIVTMNQNTNTVDVIKVLEEKITNMKKISETPYKTTGVITGFSDIKSETNISTLIKAYSSVSNREKAYDQSAIDLGLKTYPKFTDGGGGSEEWRHDIKLRIAIIQQREEEEKLIGYKERMSKFLSEQDQKEMLLKEMADYFNK